mgnify:CR=1 FL=1
MSVRAETPKPLIAQLFYPLPHDKPTVQVIGKGRATRSADSAELQFNFKTSPLTREGFKPIVDALIAMGIPPNAIDIRIIKSDSSSPLSLPFPFPANGSQAAAQVFVEVESVTKERLKKIVDKVTEVAGKSQDFSLSEVNLELAVKDCPALEREANDR